MSKDNRGHLTRRGWMGLTAGAAAGLGAAAVSETRAATGRECVKNTQISLAAYSVRKALTGGEMDLFGFIDWCAELGIAGTELTSYYFEEDFDTDYLHRLRNRAFRNGLTISGTAVRNNFCLPPGPEKDEEIAHVNKWIDQAAELFAPHIRIFAGRVPDGVDKATAISWTAEGIKRILDHAGERGIFIGLENHGGITTLAEDHLEICRQVGEHPWFGVNLDTGNYVTHPYEELRQAAPLAVNVQVKVEIGRGDERGPADFARIRDILRETGYRGWVALEYEAEEDPRVAVPRYLETLQKLFLCEG